MKVKLREPVYWFGPYQLAELLCFWVKKEEDEYGFERKPEWVHTFGEILSKTWLSPILQWVNDVRQKLPWNKDVIKLDYWDSWSVDHTLSPIILPLLKQLKATKHGYGMIADEDVPKHLQSIYALPKDSWEWDGNAEARYEWVLDEMIWAFEQMCDDKDEEQFWITKPEMDWDHMTEPFAEGEVSREVKWTVEGKLDHEGLRAHNQRIDRGLTLFGKYFRTLWD
jgi:hypothetical protein